MSERIPVLPDREDLRRLGVTIDREVHAGKQPRVFAGAVDDREVVVKLTVARMADHTAVAERMLMTEALAEEARPSLPRCGSTTSWCTPLVDGSSRCPPSLPAVGPRP